MLSRTKHSVLLDIARIWNWCTACDIAPYALTARVRGRGQKIGDTSAVECPSPSDHLASAAFHHVPRRPGPLFRSLTVTCSAPSVMPLPPTSWQSGITVSVSTRNPSEQNRLSIFGATAASIEARTQLPRVIKGVTFTDYVAETTPTGPLITPRNYIRPTLMPQRPPELLSNRFRLFRCLLGQEFQHLTAASGDLLHDACRLRNDQNSATGTCASPPRALRASVHCYPRAQSQVPSHTIGYLLIIIGNYVKVFHAGGVLTTATQPLPKSGYSR
jgi:hypothetical protein